MSGLIIRWRSFVKACVATLLVLLLVFSPWGGDFAAIAARKKPNAKPAPGLVSKLSEVAPPPVLLELREVMDAYRPQVKILSPRPNEVLSDDTVSVRFQVNDLPVFKDEALGLGPHLHVFLDNQPYQAVYNTSQPLVFENLSPGTHTIRVFASRPWHESFKNEGAYAQTTFHVLTKTQENSPAADQPLLTYSRPQGTYGAEPIMLDFYLTNAPLHLIAQKDSQDDIPDWRIRCTVNGYSFILDQWQPIYLQGFKPGKNWVQLEFIDENGNVVNNVFNNTARLITYEPNGTDALSKLVRGELSLVASRGIVDPNYQPPVEEPPAAIAEPTPEPTPTPEASPTPEATPEPTPATEPVLETPEPVESAKENSSPEPIPTVAIPAIPDISAPAEPTPVPVTPVEPIAPPIAPEEPAIENSVEAEAAPVLEETLSEPAIAPTSEEAEQPASIPVTPEPTVSPESTPAPEPVPSLPPVETVKAPELQESPVPAELSAPIEETPVLLVPQPVETPSTPSISSPPTPSQEVATPEEPVTPAPVPSNPPAPSATSQVGQQVSKVGRQIGEQAGQLGQKASQLGRQAGQRFGQWFDRARQSISKPATPNVSPSPVVTEPTATGSGAE